MTARTRSNSGEATSYCSQTSSGAGPEIAPIQTTTEDPADMLPPKQVYVPPELTVNKITWPQFCRWTDPGPYMFKFGWLTITTYDLTIWHTDQSTKESNTWRSLPIAYNW